MLLFSPLAFLSLSLFFGSSHIGRFHSPVHDGSVDVDEIDDDLKAEDALDDDNEFVATK